MSIHFHYMLSIAILLIFCASSSVSSAGEYNIYVILLLLLFKNVRTILIFILVDIVLNAFLWILKDEQLNNSEKVFNKFGAIVFDLFFKKKFLLVKYH